MKRFKRWIAASCVALVAPLAFGACYGHFPMVKTVLKVNGQIRVGDQKVTGVVQSIVMILLCWLYAISAFADVVIFNLIEFWTGRPVFTAYQADDGSQVTMKTLDEKILEITIEKDGQIESLYAFRDRPARLFILRKGEWIELEAESSRLGELDLITLRAGDEIVKSTVTPSSVVDQVNRDAYIHDAKLEMSVVR